MGLKIMWGAPWGFRWGINPFGQHQASQPTNIDNYTTRFLKRKRQPLIQFTQYLEAKQNE